MVGMDIWLGFIGDMCKEWGNILGYVECMR